MGLATPDHTPKGRGFRHSLTYLDGANDYFTSTTTGWCDTADPANGVPYTDLWASAGPALGRNNSWACSQTHQPASCVYEDTLFTNFTVAQILAHDAATPLFLYFAPHNVHEPLEAPQAQLDAFAFVYDTCAAAAGGAVGLGKNNSCDAQLRDPAHPGDGKTIKQCCFRQYYSAMTNLVDQHIGQVVGALKAKGMWANTFLSLSSDNGCVAAPGSPWPPFFFCLFCARSPPHPRLPPSTPTHLAAAQSTEMEQQAATTGRCAAGKSQTLRAACA